MKKFITHFNTILFLLSAMVFIASLLSTTQAALTVTVFSVLGLVLSSVSSLLMWCHKYLKGDK
jgi:hypothetical protein